MNSLDCTSPMSTKEALYTLGTLVHHFQKERGCAVMFLCSEGKLFSERMNSQFIDSDNRLRVTSSGDLRLCLFGNQGVSLRHLLQEDEQKPLLKQLVADQLKFKCSSHFLSLGDTGITPHLASVGG